jgi:lipopolysaccharide transport system ATP-binding protein
VSDVVIRSDGLGKKYLIGHEASRERYRALRDVIARTAKGFAKSAADMMRGRQLLSGDDVEEFWALKDVSFEVKRGEVVGIIGRNGAGKSTLLKILSRITEPSTGRVEIKGRVASLLEVGTGFHPELTGRENISLNGAILGMTRAEIKRKFDEIVAFAEVEKFLDTPVKRYSSGMYVRLAFAVAAHLDPEILIVDEVLAVGDAAFQKKCLGKMQDVAGHGRTVLFVSHNTAAVRAFCNRGIVLVDGAILQDASIAVALDAYANSNKVSQLGNDLNSVERSGEKNVYFKNVSFVDMNDNIVSRVKTGDTVCVRLAFSGQTKNKKSARIGLNFLTRSGEHLFLCANEVARPGPLEINAESVVYCTIPNFPLSGGVYGLTLYLERNGIIEDWTKDPIEFEVQDHPFFGTMKNSPDKWEGRMVLVKNAWSYCNSANEIPLK